MAAMWKKLMKLGDLGEQTSILDHEYLGCTQRECKTNERIIVKECSNHEFLLEQLKNCQGGRNLTQKLSRGHTAWKDMRKSALSEYCDLANKSEAVLHKASTPCLDGHNFKKEVESVGELSKLS